MPKLLLVTITLLCLLGASSPVKADDRLEKQPPRITESTFDERNKADLLNAPPQGDEDVLVMPLPNPAFGMSPFFYQDDKVHLIFSGRLQAASKGVLRPNNLIMAYLPRDKKTEAYFAEREAMEQRIAEDKEGKKHNSERMKMIRWCRSNGLDLCAAYEAVLVLGARSDYGSSTYKSFNKYFLSYMDKQSTPYSFPLPVNGEWYVVVDRTGHHRIKCGAAYAFDLVIQNNGKPNKGDGRSLEDYYAFGQPVYSQGDGVVVQAVSEHRDFPPGQSGKFNEANVVTIDYGGGIFGLYAHLKQDSVTVKVGDKVKLGQQIGEIGNSGASGLPHLHFTMLVSNSHMSMPGRYYYEESRDGRRWRTIEGEDLTEGRYIRNIEQAAE